MSKKNPVKAIIHALRLNPEGLTLLSLAELTGLHRHTCRKYVNELTEAEIVYQRDVGAAKLCYLKKNIENNEQEDRIAESIKKKRIRGYHIKLLAVVVLFSFLLSETVIIAYENSTILNATNISEMNTSPMTSTTNISDLSSLINISSDENETVNITVEPPSNQTSNLTVGIVDNTNTGSNSQNNAENSTLGPVENSTDNITSNETSDQNDSIIELPSIETPIIEPKFNVNLVYPQKITRGQEISVQADVTSDVFAKNVHLKWVLPQGMQIASGNEIHACGDLNPGSCTSQITVKTEMSDIGLKSIKVVVSYEK